MFDKSRNAGNMEIVIVDRGRNAGNMEMVIVDKGHNMYGFADEWFSSLISFWKHSFIVCFSPPYPHASRQALVIGCNYNLLLSDTVQPFLLSKGISEATFSHYISCNSTVELLSHFFQ